jgi:hypothetical protein
MLLREALLRPAELDILLRRLLFIARLCLPLRFPFLADLCLFAPLALRPCRADLPALLDFALPPELRLEPCLDEGAASATDTVAKQINAAAKIVRDFLMGISPCSYNGLGVMNASRLKRSKRYNPSVGMLLVRRDTARFEGT